MNKTDPISLEYWEMAALERPYDAICHGWNEYTFKNTRNTLADYLKLDKTMTFLDLACGLGRIAKWVAPQVGMYWGVDFSKNMIEKAREYNKDLDNVKFWVNDGYNLPMFSDEVVDVCVCEIAFQHMYRKNTKAYIKEVYRVLRPGGKFISQIAKAGRYEAGFWPEEIKDLFKGFSYELLTNVKGSKDHFVPLAIKEGMKNYKPNK